MSDTAPDTGETRPTADYSLVIDPDDVIEMLRRNDRDKNAQRSHVLRVTPPFEGEKRAHLHVSEDYTYYPPEMDPTPIHLNARTLFREESGQVPEFVWFPNRTESRSRFRKEYDLDADADPADDERWDEWWDVELEAWESAVRAHLPEQITLHPTHPDAEPTTIPVRYESEGDA